MLTVGDVLAKTLVKSQKVTFWSQKNGFGCFFFLLTAVDALTMCHIFYGPCVTWTHVLSGTLYTTWLSCHVSFSHSTI